MTLVRSIAATITAVAVLGSTAGSAGAQAIPPTQTTLTNAVTLKTFTPDPSVFNNPTVNQFTITLANTVSGSPSEYRVSRFKDFHDATWSTYSARPTLVVPVTWFPASTPTTPTRQITLYFQVRAKNPLAGRPISSVNGQTTVQPDFFTSGEIGQVIRIIYSG